MSKYVNEGKSITYTNSGSAAIDAGDVIVMGAIIGIAHEDIAVSGVGIVNITGVWELPKETGTSKGVSAGDTVYWDKTALKIVKASATSAVSAGVCMQSAGDSVATVRVKING